MKGRYVVLIFFAVLILIYSVTWFLAPDPTEEIAEETPEETPVEVETTPDMSQPQIEETPDVVEATPEPVETPAPTPVPAEPTNRLEALDPNNTNQLFLDGGQVADLIDEFGVTAVYERLYYYNRESMIDTLFFQQNLREHAVDLLALEEEENLRLMLIESLEPDYVPREANSYDPDQIDREFLEILNAPTETPITGEEMNSRLVLAGLVSDDAALDFARKAQQQFPDDKSVTLVSSAHMLTYESEYAPLSSAERDEASENIVRLVTDENYLNDFHSDYRLMGYRAIAEFSDTDRAISLLQNALERETDERLRGEIEKFIAVGAY